jgi:hypothetical protein
LLAVDARKIDMRASPYDVRSVEGCEDPLRIETSDGRKQYVEAQEALVQKGIPVREKVISAYEDALKAFL